jgi:hypothetical protein
MVTLGQISVDEAKQRFAAMTPEQRRQVKMLTDSGRTGRDAVQIVEAMGAAYQGQQSTPAQEIGAALAHGGHRLALGLDDEAAGIAAAGDALFTAPIRKLAGESVESPIAAYRRARDAQESGRERLVQRAPVGAAAGEGGALVAQLAGGSLARGAAAGVQQAATPIRALAEGAKAGAKAGGAIGAVAGFGEGRGAGDSLRDAIAGGVGGALLGAALGGVGGIPTALRLRAAAKPAAPPSSGPGPIARLAAGVDDAIGTLPQPFQRLAPMVPQVKAAAEMLRAPKAPSDPYQAAVLRAIAEQEAGRAGPATSSRVPEVTRVQETPQTPSSALAEEAEGFDPGGAAWRTWAMRTPAERTPRPDLDEAAQALRTSTRADRPPVPPTDAPPPLPPHVATRVRNNLRVGNTPEQVARAMGIDEAAVRAIAAESRTSGPPISAASSIARPRAAVADLAQQEQTRWVSPAQLFEMIPPGAAHRTQPALDVDALNAQMGGIPRALTAEPLAPARPPSPSPDLALAAEMAGETRLPPRQALGAARSRLRADEIAAEAAALQAIRSRAGREAAIRSMERAYGPEVAGEIARAAGLGGLAKTMGVGTR